MEPDLLERLAKAKKASPRFSQNALLKAYQSLRIQYWSGISARGWGADLKHEVPGKIVCGATALDAYVNWTIVRGAWDGPVIVEGVD